MAIQTIDKLIGEVVVLALQSDLRESNYDVSLVRISATTHSETMKRAYQDMDIKEMLEGKFRKVRAHVK